MERAGKQMSDLTKDSIAELIGELKSRSKPLDWPVLDALKSLALEALGMRLQIEKPRRKIVMLAKFEADDWDTMQGTFRQLETEIAMHGALSSRSVSGGYSSGHIYVCDVDQAMTHDVWAAELEAHLSSLPKVQP